ncbi:MAG: hypothetical protein WCA44_17900 [Acidobacteriaceae bacterium]
MATGVLAAPPQTIWTQAVSAILAKLTVSGAPADAYRARFEAVQQNETAFNLFPATIECTQSAEAHDAVTISADVVVRIYAAATDEVDLALDPLVLWAWRQVRADPTLGQLVSDAYPTKIEIGYLDKSSSDQVCADMTIRVEVDVDRDDPSVNKTYPAA